jgi:G3E family GTPase
VLRAKGFFWLAPRMEWVGTLSQAGVMREYGPAGTWWAAGVESPEELEPETADAVGAVWEEPWGDRRQELVFIGQALDREKMETALDACLLTDAEMAGGPAEWRGAKDPFPAWSDLAGDRGETTP